MCVITEIASPDSLPRTCMVACGVMPSPPCGGCRLGGPALQRVSRSNRVTTSPSAASGAAQTNTACTAPITSARAAPDSSRIAWSTQSQLATAMGVTGATLTHHLKGLEADGLVRRWREPANGREQRVALTPDGVEMFERLRAVAQRHDERLRSTLSDGEISQLRTILDRLDAGLHAPGDLGV